MSDTNKDTVENLATEATVAASEHPDAVTVIVPNTNFPINFLRATETANFEAAHDQVVNSIAREGTQVWAAMDAYLRMIGKLPNT